MATLGVRLKAVTHIDNVTIVFTDGIGYDPEKLQEPVPGHYGHD
jgi:hypothetical protein